MADEKTNGRRPIIDKKTGFSIGVIILIVGIAMSYTTLQTQFTGHVKDPFLHKNIVDKLEAEYVSQTEIAPMKEDIIEIKSDVKQILNNFQK
ncbi:hypothetical protein CL614_10445 [archaeon]|jgi:hypothetical protein|nr:hypothetical protein [archaeon]|tara:strand:+ start:1270 stop:1545 length:276 start_codon:yes stop_codon:yes gene_type:complete